MVAFEWLRLIDLTGKTRLRMYSLSFLEWLSDTQAMPRIGTRDNTAHRRDGTRSLKRAEMATTIRQSGHLTLTESERDEGRKQRVRFIKSYVEHNEPSLGAAHIDRIPGQ